MTKIEYLKEDRDIYFCNLYIDTGKAIIKKEKEVYRHIKGRQFFLSDGPTKYKNKYYPIVGIDIIVNLGKANK